MTNFFLDRYTEKGHLVREFKLRQSIRVNTLKVTEKELVDRLKGRGVKLEKIPFLDSGYYASSKFSLGSTPEYLQGFYYIQEVASQVPVQVLGCTGGKVLDACAAPGGKTTQLAQYMANRGTLIALELKKERLDSLRNNLARLGVTNTVIYNLDAKYSRKLEITFDKILLDAPCSGNLVSDKLWLQKRDIQGVKRNAKVQKQLLQAQSDVLRSTGEMVYSTCSLEVEEDEEVVEYGVDNLGLEVVKISGFEKFQNKELKSTLKFWPDVSNTQGFFVAKLRKTRS